MSSFDNKFKWVSPVAKPQQTVENGECTCRKTVSKHRDVSGLVVINRGGARPRKVSIHLTGESTNINMPLLRHTSGQTKHSKASVHTSDLLLLTEWHNHTSSHTHFSIACMCVHNVNGSHIGRLFHKVLCDSSVGSPVPDSRDARCISQHRNRQHVMHV